MQLLRALPCRSGRLTFILAMTKDRGLDVWAEWKTRADPFKAKSSTWKEPGRTALFDNKESDMIKPQGSPAFCTIEVTGKR